MIMGKGDQEGAKLPTAICSDSAVDSERSEVFLVSLAGNVGGPWALGDRIFCHVDSGGGRRGSGGVRGLILR